MLNLWIGYKEFENTVSDPDFYFSEFIDPRCLDEEFSKRVLKDCSDVQEVINYANILLPTGELISPRELSSGAKNILIMKYDEDEAVCNMVWCGDNCNKFVGEIADERDITVFTTRWYNPYKEATIKSGVKILNTGRIVHSSNEYLDYLVESGLSQLI